MRPLRKEFVASDRHFVVQTQPSKTLLASLASMPFDYFLCFGQFQLPAVSGRRYVSETTGMGKTDGTWEKSKPDEVATSLLSFLLPALHLLHSLPSPCTPICPSTITSSQQLQLASSSYSSKSNIIGRYRKIRRRRTPPFGSGTQMLMRQSLVGL